MIETKFDPSKISDFEIAMIYAEINCCYHRIEQLSEIINKVGEAKGYSDTAKTAPTKKDYSQLQDTDLTKLPWKSYKTKQAADPEEAGWIFSNTQGAEALVSTIKAKDGKAKIGNFEYQLQGAERQFIARKSVK